MVALIQAGDTFEGGGAGNEVGWEIPTSVSEIPVVSGIPVQDVTR